MKKKVFAVLLAATLALSMTACGGGSNSSSGSVSEEKTYVEVSDVVVSPKDYKGKYVNFTGRVMQNNIDGDNSYIQVYTDPTNYDNNVIVHIENPASIETDSYVTVDGQITGTFKGTNAFGTAMEIAQIEASSVEATDYITAVVPTVSDITPENAISEQNGVSLKVDKIEFAEKETRVYLTASNTSADKFSFSVYDIRIIQNGQQIEQDSSSSSSYEGNYAELSYDVLAGASTSGILVFPAMDSTSDFQIYAEGYSDNYELDFSPFTIDISVQ